MSFEEFGMLLQALRAERSDDCSSRSEVEAWATQSPIKQGRLVDRRFPLLRGDCVATAPRRRFALRARNDILKGREL